MATRLVPTPAWINHYIKISLCVCDRSGMSMGWNRLVTHDLHTLCCVDVISSLCNWGEQQLKRIQTGSSSWSRMRSRSMHWSGRKQGAAGSDHVWLVLTSDATAWRLLAHQDMELCAVCRTHTKVVKESRLQKHTYVCRAPCCVDANRCESSSDLLRVLQVSDYSCRRMRGQ